ncbi:ABC transporter ATP-binding protein [Allobaculum stercoricanis]|uniref:ABC transporter ATP-binding protein n=1 Tax=Allobaculum stercoricanis TaxID=174709 RepID=UPI0023F25603|nr:ABC transporter ATP-binding protein [Allobaculum stercoricanis]
MANHKTPVIEKRLTLKQCLTHLLRYAKHYWKEYVISFVSILLTCVIFIFMPVVEGKIITQLQHDLTDLYNHVAGAHIHMDLILLGIASLSIVMLGKTITQYVTSIYLNRAIQSTMYDLRKAISHKINQLPISYFDAHQTGDLLSRITTDVESLSNALVVSLDQALNALIMIPAMMTMLFVINKQIFCIVLIGIPLILLLSFLVVRKIQPIFDLQQQTLANMSSTINEMYSGISEILIYNRQDYAIDQFEEVNAKMKEAGFKAQVYSGLIGPGSNFITYMVIAFSILVGSFQVLNGTLALGDLQAAIRYIWNINDPVSRISQLTNALQSGYSGMNRLFSFLTLPDEIQSQTKQKISEVQTIGFKHVEFSYTDQPLMQDMNFHVQDKQTIAIVGHTGAGKTTITNLLERFYEIQGGSIQINDQDIRDLSYSDLRDLIGLVLQDPWLFEGTIEENLRYAKDGLSESDLQHAIEMASLQETIQCLPMGLQTSLGEDGENLSQGEKQLLTIARALLKDPQILILDEATSSVDTRLEKKLQQAMDAIMKNRTCFVIAHRLSTIVNADRIMVIDQGNLIESGTHQELLEKNGAYAKLYNAQFQEDLDSQASAS